MVKSAQLTTQVIQQHVTEHCETNNAPVDDGTLYTPGHGSPEYEAVGSALFTPGSDDNGDGALFTPGSSTAGFDFEVNEHVNGNVELYTPGSAD